MPAGLDFQFSFRSAPRPTRQDAADVFRLLVMGDFSGGAKRSASLAGRTPAAVDVDNFETLFGRFAPRLDLHLESGAEVALEFGGLEDFHPDALYRRLPLFQTLRERRVRLMDPASFADAVAEMQADQGAESDSTTLERLLGAAPGTTAPRPAGARGTAGIVDALLRQAVAPHVVAAPSPQRDVYLQGVDGTVAAQMRALLHHPRFQALETAWLGLRSLVGSLGGNEEIRLAVLDVSREELASDLAAAGGEPQKSGLWAQLAEGGAGAPGGEPWSAIAVNLEFGPGADDLKLLASLGAVAAGMGAPILAGASPALLGISSIAAQPDPRDWQALAQEDAARWQALRRSTLAPWIGLALPRILQRLPYGRRGEPVESFPFEELDQKLEHEACAWGNPALALGQLLGLGYLESGDGMVPGDVTELDDLPAYVHEVDGERRLLPCAEALLGERATDALLSRGLMPILSYRDRNAARLVRFQSIADPAAALSGPWGE
ncbi:MAG: type VI secretion system contractile sheath large subunit [Rhodocyclaceae bacterium]|nr:type VI secretion system contractile sheath large subunit [Rhodocyclaceae bacterium]